MFEEKYYQELSKSFPTKEAIITEIINLEAILSLPKGTEYFISDIHGEIDGFHHILKTGAGIIGDKIRQLFPEMSAAEQRQLALIVAYPQKMIQVLKERGQVDDLWYRQTLKQLIQLTRLCARKYTRSKVRKALPSRFVYVMEELLYLDTSHAEKDRYYEQLVTCLIDLDQIEDLLFETSRVIKHLVIDHIHIVGDIFDRGPASDKVMDKLMELPSVDIQWGNHDLLWLGAYCGSAACLMTLLRIATRYGHLYGLEKAYQINLRPLFLFAENHYQPNPAFYPKENSQDQKDQDLLSQVHQALTILQFKLEDQIIDRRPDFAMENRQLLRRIKGQKLVLDAATYPLENTCFDTINWENPGHLTDQEQHVVESLMQSFQASHLMQVHMRYLYRKGSIYTIYNYNLLYHGCIPLTPDGQLASVNFEGKTMAGRQYFDFFNEKIAYAYRNRREASHHEHDYLWYAWLGPYSPVYGRDQMTTFERYFIKDKASHKEKDAPYFDLRNQPETAALILREFGLDPSISHIINGHTPVKAGSGESPINADGKLLVIDGGLSKAYQKKTSIGGYTLINDSYGMYLVTHQPFIDVASSFDAIVKTEKIETFDEDSERQLIKDSTIGSQLQAQIRDLRELLGRY